MKIIQVPFCDLIFECQLCKATLRAKNPKSFTGVASRHRKKKHPKYRGTLRYSVIEPSKN